jgi:uncharacterized protein YcaQ
VNVSAEDARHFLVARHLLAPARSLKGGRRAVLEFLRRFGSIQFDPIAVAGRSHDLVLHARIAGYDPDWSDSLYERRELFEAINKGLSLIRAEDYPWFRRSWSPYARGILADNADVAGRVLARVRAEGPLAVGDFERERGAATDWFGAPANVVRIVLEAYTTTGVLALARRDGNRRYYDVVERLLPSEVLAREVPITEQFRHMMLSRYRAHGLLGASTGGDVFGNLGPAKPNPKLPGIPGRTVVRQELIDSGELVAVDVEGVRGKRYVVRDEAESLAKPAEPSLSVAFLSPFDPLIWDRPLLASLFGFDYVWDLFFPPAKRRFGWYVLPIIFRDRFVGRIEPRIERDEGAVKLIGLWWEDGFAPRRAEGFVDAMRDALRAYVGFAKATRLEWAPHLSKDKRLFGASP